MSQRFHLDPDNKNALPGLILIVLGVLGLFGTLGVLKGIGGFFGALLFGGLAYFAYVEGRRRQSLALRLAALPLAGLAIATLAPGGVGGAAFLASIGAAFGVVWYLDDRRWWALIPAGTLLSLAIVAFLDASLGGSHGAIFLLGLAATFFALTRLRVEAQPWAIFPAAALAVLGLLSITTGGRWLVPLVLIAIGGFLLMRSGSFRLSMGRHEGAAPGAYPPATPPSGAPEVPVAQAPVAQTPVAQAPAPVPPVAAVEAPEAPAAAADGEAGTTEQPTDDRTSS